MIMNIIMALALAFLVATYWAICRRRALKYQEEAAVLLEKYFADGQVSDKDKESLFNDYRLSRKFYMLPVFAVATPFVLAYMLLEKGRLDMELTPRDNPKLYAKACDLHLKMMISKNPIISIICLSFIGVCFVIALTFAILLNKLSSPPTFDGVAALFSRVGSKAVRKAHLH